MSLKIRLARGGAKKRPYYRIVVADTRSPRDGRFIEKLGTYDPMQPKDSAERVKLDIEKAKDWLAKGAQPTDRVARFLDAAGVLKREARNNPEKAQPEEEGAGARRRAGQGRRRRLLPPAEQSRPRRNPRLSGRAVSSRRAVRPLDPSSQGRSAGRIP